MRLRRIAAQAVVALFATFASVATCCAGCDANDLLNGLANAAESIGSNCATACADGAGCGVSAAIAATLGGIATDSGQGEVNQICSAVQQGLKSANSGTDDANTLASLLTQYGVSSAVAQQLAQQLAGVAGVLGVAGCGCAIEQGVGQVGNDLGACIQDALCSLDALIGSPCSCTAPPPIQANCALPATGCGYFDTDPLCQGNNTIIRGPAGYEPVTSVQTAAGTYVSVGGDSSDGNGHCSAVDYCFCPAPMQPTWLQDTAYDSSGQFYIFTCLCPGSTHPGAAVGGIPVCLCDNTNQPMQPPGSLFGTCPPLSCGAGQVKIDNKCVATCSDPTEIMLSGGQCCNPAQATSCGTCCPPGQSPDAATGSCTTRPTPVTISPRRS
jgi:hypothetical protein